MTCIYFVDNSEHGCPCVTILPRAEIRRVDLDVLDDDDRTGWEEEEDPDNVRVHLHVWLSGADVPHQFGVYGMTSEDAILMFEEVAYNDFDGDVTFTCAAKGRWTRADGGRPERTRDRSYVKAVP